MFRLPLVHRTDRHLTCALGRFRLGNGIVSCRYSARRLSHNLMSLPVLLYDSLFVGSIVHVFEKTYGFTSGQGGTVLITGFVGAVLGWLTNYFIQERFYQASLRKGHGKAVPEVRLYSSAIGGLLFAVGCFCL